MLQTKEKSWKNRKWENNSSKHSSWWLPKIRESAELDKLFSLISLKKSVTNFVKIQCGQDIPCKIYGSQSFTDKKSIVISAEFKNLDLTVGLSLHEASHIKWTDYTSMFYIDACRIFSNSYTGSLIKNQKKFTIELNKYLANLNHSSTAMKHESFPSRYFELDCLINKLNINDYNVAKFDFLKDMLNFVEDRRIDALAIKNAPGYYGYYETLYDKYFRNKNISEMLKSSMYRKEDILSYSCRIINLLNKDSDLDALKGLRTISKIIDIDNILRLKDSYDSLDVAIEVSKVVFDMVDFKNEDSENEDSENEDSENEDSENEDSNSGNKNTGSGKSTRDENGKRISKIKQNEIENEINITKEFIRGNVVKKKIVGDSANSLESLIDSNSTLESSEFGNVRVGVMVLNDLNRKLLNSGTSFLRDIIDGEKDEHLKEFIVKGLQRGKLLGNKLKIRNDIKLKQTIRKKTGKIDKRLLSEAGFGNNKIFKSSRKTKYNDVHLHLSIDASGSMHSYDRFNIAISTAACIAKAASMIDGIHVVISLRGTSESTDYLYSVPYVMKIYNSKKDKINKILNLWPHLRSDSYTPEGLCFEAVYNEMENESKDVDKYFVNLSDGMPGIGTVKTMDGGFLNYASYPAIKQTKKAVNKLRKKGIKILSYYISNSSVDKGLQHASTDKFKEMYGKDSAFIDVESISQIANTLNKMFLDK